MFAITDFLNHWQTLIAGLMALAAGVGTIFQTRCASQKQVSAANQQTDALREQNTDLRQRHEDQFKPICMLVPDTGVDPWYERRGLIEIGDSDPPNPRFAKLKFGDYTFNNSF